MREHKKAIAGRFHVQRRMGTLIVLAVLIAALAGVAYVAGSVYVASTRMRTLGAAVFQFARQNGRMPPSPEEMVQAGYLKSAGAAEPGKYLVIDRARNEPVGPPIDINRYEIPWGVQPDQLIEHNKILHWRDRPEQRALLVRDRRPPLMVRVMGGRLAMAFPPELHRELTQARPSTATQAMPQEPPEQ